MTRTLATHQLSPLVEGRRTQLAVLTRFAELRIRHQVKELNEKQLSANQDDDAYSRDKRTAIELFIASARGRGAGLRRCLVGGKHVSD
jgi:hypothetical protein